MLSFAIWLGYVPLRVGVDGRRAVSLAGSSDPSSGARFAFDARRWTRYEVITASLSLALLASLTRPWFEVRAFNCPPELNRSSLSSWAVWPGRTGRLPLDRGAAAARCIMTLLVLRAGLGKISFLVSPDDPAPARRSCLREPRHRVGGAPDKVGGCQCGRAAGTPSPYAGLSITWESAAYIALTLCAAAAVAAVLNLPTVHRAAATSTKQSLRRVASRTASFLLARTSATRQGAGSL